MSIVQVEALDTNWKLCGALGESLHLARVAKPTEPLVIGTIGTRRAVDVKGNLTRRFAERLAELNKPIILLDVRRTGMGGSGSWGPAEFGSVIPDELKKLGVSAYSFYHLPQLAPSMQLLGAWRRAAKAVNEPYHGDVTASAERVACGEEPDTLAWRHWQVFRAAYNRQIMSELNGLAIRIGRALAEAAHSAGGVAVLLFAEERCSDFDQLSQQQQDACYCHRFTLARAIARSLQRDWPASEISRLDLAVGEETHKNEF